MVQIAGPNYPASASSQSFTGSNVAWSNPSNALAADGITALASGAALDESAYLILKDYGFSIPAANIIVGIVVEVNIKKASGSSAGAQRIGRSRIIKAGSVQSTDVGANTFITQTSLAITTLGSPSEKWGTTWTPADINSATFGWALSVRSLDTGVPLAVDCDYGRITVYHVAVAHSGVSFSHAGKSHIGPFNTPGTLSFTGGADVTQYEVRTAPSGGGTLVASGAAASGANNKSIAYNATGLVDGANTLYLRTGDGTNWSGDTSFTLNRDATAPTVSVDSYSPDPVGTSKQYAVQFDGTDATTTGANQMSWQLRTASGGGGALVASGLFTQGLNRSTGTITDAGLAEGSNTRYLRIFDGANNVAETSFTVAAVLNTAPTVTGAPAVTYADGSSTHERSTPFAVAFTAHDDQQTGADALTYEIRTAASGGGTLVASGTCTSDIEEEVAIAYDATGLVDGEQTLYLRVSDGTVTSSDSSFTVTRRIGLDEQSDLRWRLGGAVADGIDLRWRMGGRVTASTTLNWRIAPSPNRVQWALEGRFGPVVYGWRYERRTTGYQFVDDVTPAIVAASGDLNNDRDILRTARFTIDPQARDAAGNLITIDTLADHIAVICELLVDGSYRLDLPMGLFALSRPRRRIEPSGETWDVDANDLAIHLREATTTTAYTEAAGSKYIANVAAILDSFGLQHALPSSDKVRPAAKTWPVGTPWLEIVNEDLDAINHYVLFFDERAVARTRVRDELAARTPDVTYTSEWLVLSPIEQEDDPTRFANQVVGIVEDPNRAPLSAVLTNDDPANPISTVRLGRTITKVLRTDAADLATLQAYLQSELEQSSAMYQRRTVLTPIDPRRSAHEIYGIVIDGVEETWWVRNWSMEFKTGAVMRHQLGRVQKVVAS